MLVAFQRATGWALPRPAVAVQQPPHSRDRATDLELAADQRLDAFQGPPLIFPAMHGRPLGQLLFQQGEPLVRQLRQLRGPLRPQPLHTALTPVPAPLLHRTLAHPQVLGNVRSPVTPGEPLPGLQPDPLTRSPPLSRQAPTFRIPHSTGIPQGSPNVTTRRQPEKVSSHRSWNPNRGAGQDVTRSCIRPIRLTRLPGLPVNRVAAMSTWSWWVRSVSTVARRRAVMRSTTALTLCSSSGNGGRVVVATTVSERPSGRSREHACVRRWCRPPPGRRRPPDPGAGAGAGAGRGSCGRQVG